MKILILGSGFISTAYATALEHLGYEPLIASRTFIDYTMPDVLDALLERYKPKAVINASGFVGDTIDDCERNKAECVRANVELPYEVAKLCKKFSIPLLHVSSGCIFNGPGPFTETDVPNPVSFYAECKVAAEKAIADV